MFFSAFSIKQKLIIALIVAVLASTILVGTISQWIARDLLHNSVQDAQLPNMVKQVANRVDKEVSVMKTVAQSIATNPDINAWSAAGAEQAGEARLVNYLEDLVNFNNLTVASYVDRFTYKYWNQEGFLRTLQNDNADGWFFAYKESGEPISLSLYNEKGQGYRLFANYQQVNGRGMSGVAKSVDELVDILNRVKIAATGLVFMVDGNGTVIAHSKTELLGSANIGNIAGSDAAAMLLNKNDFNLATATVNGEEMLFASTFVKSAGWYVVAQVPEAELYDELDKATTQMVLWALLIAVVFATIGVWLAGSITRPIERLADVFQNLGRGEGDLTLRINVPEQKEMGRLVEGFNNFIASLHSTISAVAATSNRLRESASNVADKSRVTEEISKVQRDHTMQVAAALTEMGTTVNEIARSAMAAASHANESSTTSDQGRTLTKDAVQLIKKLANQVTNVANVIRALDEHTSAIGSILDTIRSISEQTNLLALNAAIEAARAGEHGRGFSVVADEVRALAQRAASATDEIQQKIDKFQLDSRQAVAEMQTSQAQTEAVVTATNEIDKVLQSIIAGINEINDINTQVATATEEQTVVVENINVNINDISTSSNDNLETASQLVRVSEQLDNLASELASQVSRFKL
ncbi:methyl-accepting chemotaxis protein [Alteromonas pelagimontana]|uniref:Methyl-accepting chemotaxis protein n=1 Tax=Alteromonas pelagimontana TaxID=1858656 RepID=A0A6M4MBU2_9ALTE|nr:methyl-accepting chemotaxis protein [Alteromonas pelagimontana]QJR80613.1 methyl-accepting chemotaxis protein [Alteromonas pelagimontana]